MAFVLSDRIKETTTTTGTGTYTLGGAVSGFETFTANLSNGDTTYYCCTDGTDFEVGLGTFTSSGTTLARTTIISSSNSNNAVSWSSGSRDIFCTLPGSKAIAKNGDGDITLADDEEIKLGADGDLRIFHDGSNSRIEDNGSGSLILKANPLFHVEKTGTSELMIKTTADGAVKLYHDNSEKLETESTGVKVTGNLEAEDGYIGFGNISADNWGKLEFLSSDPTQFTSEFGNAVSLDNEQGSTNQQLFLFDTSSNDSRDLLGVAASGVAILSITGQGNIVFKRPNGDTSNDITLACPTPSAARTVTLPDATGTVSLITATETLTNKTLTSPKINEDVAVTATATEINKLDGVTATTTELNYVDVTTLGTVEASKAVTADANGDVKFSDNDKAVFGTGGDLQISHTGSNSLIQDSGTGDLFIQGSSAVKITDLSSNEMAVFNDGGTVELYHNNSKVFETASTGVTIEDPSDSAASKSLRIIGKRSDANDSFAFAGKLMLATNRTDQLLDTGKTIGIIGFGGNHTDATVGNILYSSAITGVSEGDFNSATDMPTGLAFFTGSTGRDPDTPNVTINTERMRIDKDGNIGIGTTSPSTKLEVVGDLTVTSTDAGSSDGPILKLFRDSSSPADNDELGEVRFHGRNSANEDINYGGISCSFIDVTDSTEDTRIEIKSRLDGSLVTYYQAKFGLNEFRKPVKMLENTNIVFEGGTADANETTLTVAGPTADRTITLPDATGTVLTTGNSDTPTTTTSSSDADFVLVDDGGTMKKITPANLGITSGGASKGFAVAMAIAL